MNKLNHNFKIDAKKQNLYIINKSDFLSTLMKEYKMRKVKDKERIQRDFDRLDKKKKGELSIKHLKKYLVEDKTLTEEDVDEFIKGSDSKLKMNKDQFVEWVYRNGIYGCGKEYLGPFLFGPNYSKLKIVSRKDKINL